MKYTFPLIATVLTALILNSCSREIDKEVITESKVFIHEFTEEVMDQLAEKIANRIADKLGDKVIEKLDL